MKPVSSSSLKSVRLIFVGGFLGSGKTTAIAAVARNLLQDGYRVGVVTNDQTENLVDTVVARKMLSELGVPVEEVVKGCFCCKFDELIAHMEKIRAHDPDFLLGEPVGSCTDFVAAVANPIKIHYRDAFHFAPFSTMTDPDRVQGLLLSEHETGFPEEVRYLFTKQLEEADVILLSKADLIEDAEKTRLLEALRERYPQKTCLAVSASSGEGMDAWMKILLSQRPGAGTVLREIDYDRYARAEAVLGWLNASIRLTASTPFDAHRFLKTLSEGLRDDFRKSGSQIGHLKSAMTHGGKAAWMNLTHLAGNPVQGGDVFTVSTGASLIMNARIRMEPSDLEASVRTTLERICARDHIRYSVEDLQCFSPAYPEPPYQIREPVE